MQEAHSYAPYQTDKKLLKELRTLAYLQKGPRKHGAQPELKDVSQSAHLVPLHYLVLV